ncbi:MAG: hypothetical protein ACI9OJ_001990 [Myxococcota bacterium]
MLFNARGYVVSGLHQSYSVAPDDQRFLMVREVGERRVGDLIVIENWFQELGVPPGTD